ncbi:phage baseplate upper protein [Bacillus velezensis]|uniref:phage baseplate upper protein n=1 Tax=Bacillus velezensis TaxID=492670 RepID=UPI001E626C5D|nr:phage baseplate upper protein [Bacillus velezensis]URD66392.1 phage baseplate upper protein [Bacillus velezensis]WED89722.1 phage baseplate upper protein [Bacillus velezensis]WFB55410.1 phage baseplate upper protein [Bacillus velezensis]
MYNNAPLAFEVTSWTKTNIKTAIQFSTQDIDTARLIFSLTKDGVPLPLSAVTGKLVMFMADGSRFIKNVEIVDKVEGIAQHVLSPEEIRHYGDVQAELNLYYANKQSLSVHKFSFTIDKALIDTDIVPIAEYYIDDFEDLIVKVNELYDEAIATMEELRQKFSDLENIETKAGAQEKADAAETNTKAYTDLHANNKTIHITADDRTTWNAKETTLGSQDKADKALVDAKAYTDTHANRTDNPHAVTKEQIGLANVEDIKQASFTDFQAHNYNQVRHISADERKVWNGAVTYINILLKNGATAGTRTPMYAKWGPFLILRGHVKTDPEIIFGSIPASYAPTGGSVTTVPLSGTGGTANLIIYDNGDLKIKYPDPVDSSKIGGGYYLDIVVGFQDGGTV